jgi:calcineurin-like phosphoesterase family protein
VLGLGVADMVGSNLDQAPARKASAIGVSIVDPREGDAEDDASSTIQRSLFSIAGSLLAEISLPKLLFAWTLLILLPAVLLGAAPLLATAWLAKASASMIELSSLGAVLILLLILVIGWQGWRPLVRIVEASFWSLNALAVQPGYALCREALRHLAERRLKEREADLAKRRAASSAGAGIILCILAILAALVAWPHARWAGTVADLLSPHALIVPTLANAVVVVSVYLSIAALVWGFADASMRQPRNLDTFDLAAPGDRTWRVAHLSDIHVVGERCGFRIESGRRGPRGNDRLERVLDCIEAMHLVQPLDLVLVTGDLTDAGRSTEWAEFLDIVARRRVLADRLVVLPGNHDVNIVDRTNPARLNLPFSPGKRLRQIRALSAIASVQGDRMRVVDHETGRPGRTLVGALEAQRQEIIEFAHTGSLRMSARLRRIWSDQFPMILPPKEEDGLGVAILNSNAETHFSFTNALGLISAEQARRLASVIADFPRAVWIIALHHHLMEYPMRVSAFSERVGTALVNGSWFVRKLLPLASRAVVLHGHRHIDWIGACGDLRIISAPSPVMGVRDDEPTYFYIHTLTADLAGRVRLLSPQRVDITGVESGPEAVKLTA